MTDQERFEHVDRLVNAAASRALSSCATDVSALDATDEQKASAFLYYMVTLAEVMIHTGASAITEQVPFKRNQIAMEAVDQVRASLRRRYGMRP